MPQDETMNLYRCTICDKVGGSRKEIREHVMMSGKGRHNVDSASDADMFIEVRTPRTDLEELFPIGEWEEMLRRELTKRAPETRTIPRRAKYKSIANDLDLPAAFVSNRMVEWDVEPEKSDGNKLPKTFIKESWDDLKDSIQDTLLAWAYFPEKNGEEITALEFSGAETDPTVYTNKNDYGWMLIDDNVGGPLVDWDPDRNGEKDNGVELEGIDRFAEEYFERGDEDEEADDEEVAAEVPDETLEEAEDILDEIKEEAEKDQGGYALSADDGAPDEPEPVVGLDADEAFESIRALIESGGIGSTEAAQRIFNRAVGKD